MEEAALLAAACPEVGALSGRGAPGRESAVIGGLRCVRMGLDEPWATRAYAMDPPSGAGLAEALSWLTERSPSYRVVTRAEHATAAVFHGAGLTPADELPALVLERAVAPGAVPGLAVRPARSPGEFLTAYGAELAPLVVDADLADPGQVHLVGLLDGDVVGCARVRRAAGTGYVSAVSVLRAVRRRGIGAVLTEIAGQAALDRGWRPVWLHATSGSAPLYRRLGYRLVDVHVELAPSGQAAARTARTSRTTSSAQPHESVTPAPPWP
ncbi:MAG: GNAT family N-acetyltransferase [Actinomycetes bacterium]